MDDEAPGPPSDCPPEIVAVAALVGVRSRELGSGPPPSVIVSSPFCAASVTVALPAVIPPQLATSWRKVEHWV